MSILDEKLILQAKQGRRSKKLTVSYWFLTVEILVVVSPNTNIKMWVPFMEGPIVLSTSRKYSATARLQT